MNQKHLAVFVLATALLMNLPLAYASTSTFITPVVNAILNGGFTNGSLGVATSSPAATLAVSLNVTDATTTMNSTAAFIVASTTGTGVSTTTVNLFKIARSGLVSQDGLLPTVATSTGAGSGSAPVILVGNSNDVTFNLVTGTAPAASGVVGTFSLPTACPTGNMPMIYPASANATAVASVYASSTGVSTFNVVASSSALVASTNYIWNIHIGCF